MSVRSQKQMVLFLVGPTACGKTDVAVELAQRINGEIISCDSMQVYKEMSILNSKPKTTQLKKIAHHLISSVSVSNDYNVTKYRKGALIMMGKILRKEKVPLFVGGSGLYVKVLLDGIFETDREDKKIRGRLYAQAQRQGKDKLFSKLKKIDPPAATKIHPNDLRRIVRALEVYEVTKVPISVWQKRRRGIIDDFDVRIFGMERKKTDLYKRIDRRLNLMFKKGLLKEVKKLLGLKLSKTVKQALGVKEIKGYLNGLYSLKDAKDMLKINTYRLVKKQSTWFRKEKRINWIKVKDFETDKDIARKILNSLKQ